MQGYEAGLAVAVQVAHDGEIDPDHDAVDGVGTQVVAGGRAVIGVVGEQGGQQLAMPEAGQEDEQAGGAGHDHTDEHGGASALTATGAYVLRGKSGQGREHGARDDEEQTGQALRDADACRGCQTEGV